MSAYDTKIQKALAKLSIGLTPTTIARLKLKGAQYENGKLPTTIVGDDEFKPKGFYYASKRRDCDLCGHPHLKRVFVIESVRSGNEAHIGSECATNYLDADIVKGLCKHFDLEYNKIVNPIKFEDGIEALEWAKAERFRLPSNLTRLGIEGVTYTWNLINSGSSYNVLNKIYGGKPITKREKQVIAAYQWFYDHRNEVEVVKALQSAVNHLKKIEIKVAQDRREREARNQAAFRSFTSKLKHVLANPLYYEEEVKLSIALHKAKKRDDLRFNEEKFLNDVTYRIESNLSLTPKQERWLFAIADRPERDVTEESAITDVVKEKLHRLADKDLNYYDSKFVNDMSSKLNRGWNFSPKQVAYLDKVIAKVY